LIKIYQFRSLGTGTAHVSSLKQIDLTGQKVLGAIL